MINTLCLDRKTLSFIRTNDPDQISNLCAHGSNVIWVDVTNPESRDFDDLAREFNFHPLANTATTAISPEGLMAFIRSCGREPAIIAL